MNKNKKQIKVNKIILIIIVATVMIATLTFSGCNEQRVHCYDCNCCTCDYDGTLVNYKAVAIKQLQEFANTRGQENFSEENWARIEGYVAEAKVRIAAAESSFGIILILVETRCNIKAVPQEEVYSGITAELEARIRQTILEYWHSRGRINLTIDDVWFLEFGYYNGAVALRKGYGEKILWGLADSPWHEEVSGIHIFFHSSWPIVIWRENRILSITDAYYKYNLLTVSDLRSIERVSWNGMDSW